MSIYFSLTIPWVLLPRQRMSMLSVNCFSQLINCLHSLLPSSRFSHSCIGEPQITWWYHPSIDKHNNDSPSTTTTTSSRPAHVMRNVPVYLLWNDSSLLDKELPRIYDYISSTDIDQLTNSDTKAPNHLLSEYQKKATTTTKQVHLGVYIYLSIMPLSLKYIIDAIALLL